MVKVQCSDGTAFYHDSTEQDFAMLMSMNQQIDCFNVADTDPETNALILGEDVVHVRSSQIAWYTNA